MKTNVYRSQQKKAPFLWSYFIFKKLCFYWHLSETKWTLWKDASRELSDVQWLQVLKGSLQRSGVRAGIILLPKFTSLLQNLCGVSRNVHVPDQWLKGSCMCWEMKIFCYPSQLQELFLASVKRNWWVLTRLKSSLQSRWLQWLSRRRNNVLLTRDVNLYRRL